MAGIDADLMRAARDLFARFQNADPTNAGRFWKQLAADAPKLEKGRPLGSADPDGDRRLLRFYDLVADFMPEFERGRLSAVARIWFDKYGSTMNGPNAGLTKLRRLLEDHGEKRFTQEERDDIIMASAYARAELAKASGEPLKPLSESEIAAFNRFVARVTEAELAKEAAAEEKRRQEMAEILRNPDRYPITKPD
jgi:hypothetical protein